MAGLDPAGPEHKHRTRESQRQLRKLLLTWDPIGVAGAPEAADEYDCLISPLMNQLHAGVEEADIVRWLVTELRNHFGLPANWQRERQFARNLTDWWRQRSATLPAK